MDVASTPAVSYIVKMVQGATRSMLIDHAYLLESHFAHELPEALIGAIRWAGPAWTSYTWQAPGGLGCSGCLDDGCHT